MAKEPKEEKGKEKVTKKKYEVEILDRSEITTYPKLRKPTVTIQITYSTPNLPPATISIPKEEYNKEIEMKKIKEDIERRLKFKPEVYKV